MQLLRRIGRFLVIRTRIEAYLIIYALAVGATARAQIYLVQYPGTSGKILALACTGAVFLGGAAILDATPKRGHNPRLKTLRRRWRANA